MNRRKFIGGLSGATLGIVAMFATASQTDDGSTNPLLNNAYSEINVEEALIKSSNGIVLHHGEHMDKNTLESIKYAISRMGFQVTTHFGGPDGAIASYAFGNNFPAAHYDDRNKNALLTELQKLATLHHQALNPNLDP